MIEYIAKHDVLKAIEKRSTQNGTEPGFHSEVADMLMQEIKAMPAQDVAPVVYGEWIPICDGAGAECANCEEYYDSSGACDSMEGFRLFAKYQKYCPNCGAKMDEEEETNV